MQVACIMNMRCAKHKKKHSSKTLASTHIPQGRMYSRPGDPLCPVAAMDKYLSLLNSDLNCLWQKPNDKFKIDGRWYCKMAVGHNTLSGMMKRMSVAAGLSQIYTNHCTRATASKTLGDASFDRSDIIKITGHRDTRSLDTYIGGASSSKKRALSNTLSGLTCQGNPQGNSVSTSDHIGQIDKMIMNLEDNDMSVSEKDFENDKDFELNMVTTTEEVEYQESKRPFIFNNCTFNNTKFH